MLAERDHSILALIQQVQLGDAHAFAALYQQYSALVLRTAYLLLGEYALAEDATQEVFVAVHRHLGQYRPERGAFATWLHRITVNHCTGLRYRWRWWFTMSSLASNEHQPSPAVSPLEAALLSDEQRRIWQAVQHLSMKLRSVVILRYYHNLPYSDIANILGCPIGTVRSRLNAAHVQLQRHLEDDNDAGA